MSDVARVAGVSHQTVSRVLNDHPSVRDETRARVLAAIADLGYRRNTAARALVTRRTGTIGVVTSGSALFGPTSTLIAVERAAREAGLFVSMATLARWDAAGVHQVLEHFMSQGVDGVVVIAAHDHAVEAVRAFGAPVPLVMVGPRGLDHPGLQAIAVDQYAGARIATRHLLDLGHRHVLHLAGPQDWLDARSRVRGGATSSRPPASRRASRSRAPGTPARVTRSDAGWSPTGCRPRCSRRTTSSPSGCCAPSQRPASGCPTTSRWWASTTSTALRTSSPR